MTTLFIADLHLSPSHPDLTQAFYDYLEYRAAEAATLYIIGDLFDYWIGDDAMGDFEHEVAAKIAAYADTGKDVYFIHGNRDFLIGEAFANEAHLTLLDDPSLIMLGDVPVLLAHGDAMCTDDEQYMEFRAMMRNPQWQQQALEMPIEARQAIAEQFRADSSDANANKPQNIMDVNQQAVAELMGEYQVRTLIHGHTHRPEVHDFDVNGELMRRYVVGDWRLDHDQDIDIGWEIRHDGLALTLEEFSLSELAYD
ncbi:UDP-2,3-diacylglucosamine diphosphatase [Carnimonas nigrificans]|uniref:UDP-2,3-diacylglucosamine diphosphatase n=1 Tax=Carnimonas nigrificans TaxID=64323 RepID=UPI000470C4D7|nr:UDP-2,3-diacylglucosamine diphosphatase [Carnimonas nigrificans]